MYKQLHLAITLNTNQKVLYTFIILLKVSALSMGILQG